MPDARIAATFPVSHARRYEGVNNHNGGIKKTQRLVVPLRCFIGKTAFSALRFRPLCAAANLCAAGLRGASQHKKAIQCKIADCFQSGKEALKENREVEIPEDRRPIHSPRNQNSCSSRGSIHKTKTTNLADTEAQLRTEKGHHPGAA